MTDIFISYSRKDVEMVSTLARTLEEMGYSVWWDVSGLHGGQAFAQVIQEKLSEAKCCIVIWSESSVTSNWVHSEASFADSRGILLTASYQDAQAPMPFNNRHNEDLRAWKGNVFDDGFQKLLKAVSRLCPEPSGKLRQTSDGSETTGSTDSTLAKPAKASSDEKSPKPSSGYNKKLLSGAVLAALLAAGGFAYFSIDKSPTQSSITNQPPEKPSTANTPRLKPTEPLDAEKEAAVKAKTAAEAKKAADNEVYKLANNITLLPIPAGEFMMGSNSGGSDEKPVHKVTFDKPFWMSKTEITFDQYDAYVAATNVNKPDDKGWGRGTRPVINVSWNDAQGYVKWLSENNDQSLQCRLPSEAEWEYGARAGTTTKYHWSDSANHEQANYGKDECCGGLAKGRDKWVYTAPVGSFIANRFGLQDMHGNVFEWVQDTYQKNYEGAPSNGEAWEVGDFSRGLRGGSWHVSPYRLRSAFRNIYFSPVSRNDFIGFRVVCSPPSVR